MAYSLRSQREPSPHLTEEQTDTSVINPTEFQTTANLPQAVPHQLEQPQDSSLPTFLTNQTSSTPELTPTPTLKPEVEITTPYSHTIGPTRVDPAVQSLATLSAEFSPLITPTALQEVAPAEASAFTPRSGSIATLVPSADELGPYPTVISREPFSQIHSEYLLLYTPVELPSTTTLDNSWKTSHTTGTTMSSFYRLIIWVMLSDVKPVNL